MGKRVIGSFLAAAMLAVCAAGAADARPLTLKVGDPAPEYEVASWVKGPPVERLERGRIYVVDFWATRCAPCIQAMPHMKALSEQYEGKVTFVAIGLPYDWETTEDVAKFVRRKGDLMPYAVGVDAEHGKGERMYDRWGPPAGFQGLPVTFLIDRSGRIAWTGMPMDIDEPLRAVVAGTHDIQAARRQQEADHEAAEVNSAMRETFRAALAAKEYDAVIKRVDTLVARDPAVEGDVFAYKLAALLETGKDEALTYVTKELPPQHRGTAAALLAERDDLPTSAYGFIARELEKVVQGPDAHVMSWQLLARTYHRLGDLDRAIQHQRTALEKSDAMGYTEFSATLRETLEEYLAEKAGQRG